MFYGAGYHTGQEQVLQGSFLGTLSMGGIASPPRRSCAGGTIALRLQPQLLWMLMLALTMLLLALYRIRLT